MAGSVPLEPWIHWADLSVAGTAHWDEVDALATAWLGVPCVALPSVRVGLCWAMEHRGLQRHRDHVLVPRFVGRCILGSISRFALPVEESSTKTRMAIVVDQFGLRQRMDLLGPAFEQRGWGFIEDSPYGVADHETSAPNSWARIIGLGKPLPVVQGALMVTADRELERFVRAKRRERSAWSHAVWLTMLMLRRRRVAGRSSEAADAAYELYPAARGGNRWLRGNLLSVLRRVTEFEKESRARLGAIEQALGGRVLMPDVRRLGYVVPCFAGAELGPAQAVFRQCGFDDSPYHVDVARNMLNPRYLPCVLLPLNPRIARSLFEKLLDGLRLVPDNQAS